MNRFFQGVVCIALSLQIAAVTEEETYSVSMMAKPRLDGGCLVLGDAKNTYQIYWNSPPVNLTRPLKLEANQTYTFVLELRKDTLIHPTAALIRVEQAGKTIYDQGICEVHKTRMEHKLVPIIYGGFMNLSDPAPREIEIRLFPHRREIAFGSDGHFSDDPTHRKMFVCQECKTAFEKWKESNPNTKK